jgi:hypothetical protein
MGPLPGSAVLYDLRLQDIAAYLSFTGWKRSTASDRRWLVLEGPNDSQGRLLEITLPNDEGDPERKSCLANTIHLLSTINEETPDTILLKIRYHNRDVLCVRSPDPRDPQSVSLETAARQISQLKQLVRFAASSEQEPKPHFHDALRIGNQMVERYRLGYTLAGGFGFTLESPVINEPAQLALFTDDTETTVILPLGRRILERVVRGLLTIRQAVAEHNMDKILKEYPSGFNSNMCEAIVGMSRDKSQSIEYSVLWSPKLRPSPDVEAPGVIRMSETEYRYLGDAARSLREIKPEYTVIRGMVTDLSARDAPLGASDIPRSVAVRWTNRPTGKAVKVIMALGRDDYIVAHQSHLNWDVVEVTGVVQRVGSLWQLADPHDFHVAIEGRRQLGGAQARREETPPLDFGGVSGQIG